MFELSDPGRGLLEHAYALHFRLKFWYHKKSPKSVVKYIISNVLLILLILMPASKVGSEN